MLVTWQQEQTVRESTVLVVVQLKKGPFYRPVNSLFVFPKNQSDLVCDVG